jgi:hypothetical protein
MTLLALLLTVLIVSGSLAVFWYTDTRIAPPKTVEMPPWVVAPPATLAEELFGGPVKLAAGEADYMGQGLSYGYFTVPYFTTDYFTIYGTGEAPPEAVTTYSHIYMYRRRRR